MEIQHNPNGETIPNSPPPPPPPPPPSLSSSPCHEFSFTISGDATAVVKLSKPSSSPLDRGHSPADDIFFNGHLLPLHLVSNSPSNASMYNSSFLPNSHMETVSTVAAAAATVRSSDYNGRSSPKFFSLFWLRKWLRGNDDEEDRVDEKQGKKRLKKKVFDLALLWKKYKCLVEPFLFLKDWKGTRKIRRSTQYSFSGDGWRRRGHGGLSDPASTPTSQVKSGLLVTPSATNFTSEELQCAIQAAIVHCKNSIAVEED